MYLLIVRHKSLSIGPLARHCRRFGDIPAPESLLDSLPQQSGIVDTREEAHKCPRPWNTKLPRYSIAHSMNVRFPPGVINGTGESATAAAGAEPGTMLPCFTAAR
jgi:hypothetical protein